MADGMVPITREFMEAFYSKYDAPESDPGLADTTAALEAAAERLCAGRDGSVLSRLSEPPASIDQNLWRQREQCEEILTTLVEECALRTAHGDVCAARAAAARARVREVHDTIETNQKLNSEKVVNLITKFLPSDFRGSLLMSQRKRSEVKKQAEVDALMAAGGSVADKYAMLWRQQQDRRAMLASLGSSSGAFKTLLSYIAGVPQVLLDFVTTINDDDGPVAVQRKLYGPALYAVTTFANRLRVFVQALEGAAASAAPSDEDTALLESAAALYREEMSKWLQFFRDVFEKSPFLVTAEEARAAMGGNEGGGAAAGGERERVEIAQRSTHIVQLRVSSEGTMVGWDWREEKDRETTFRVEFAAEGGAPMPMLPDVSATSHRGDFLSPAAGVYTLTWENTDLLWAGRSLLISTANVPPEDGAAADGGASD